MGEVDGVSTAVLLDGPSLQRWQAESLATMVEQTDATISLVVVNDREQTLSDRLEAFYADGWWGLYNFVSLTLRRTLGSGLRPYRESIPIDACPILSDADVVRTKPVSDGIWNELPTEVVAQVETVDVAVRFGFGLLKGEVLEAPRYGVLSFHGGRLDAYRGRGPHFWAFLDGEPTVTMTLQRLTEAIDGGDVVVTREVDVSDAKRLTTVRERLFVATEPMLAEAIETLTDPDQSVEPVSDLGPLHTVPDLRPFLSFLQKELRGRLRSWRDR